MIMATLPSLISPTVSVDVKHHERRRMDITVLLLIAFI